MESKVSSTDTAPLLMRPAFSATDVYEHLKRKILEHSIPPSTRLNIMRIAKELKVSATPVREALRLLQGDNLLEAISNKGYQTTPVLTARQVRDLFEFRLLIEPWAASAAATNRLQNPGLELDQEIKIFDSSATPTRQIMLNHDSKFHKIILQSTGNFDVVRAFEQSHCHLHLFRMFGDDWDFEASLEEHRQIAQSISNADSKAAEESMRLHLHSAYRGFTERMTDDTLKAPLGEFSSSSMIRPLT
jgi:DNA-binding GntR family transcriptional regulator